LGPFYFDLNVVTGRFSIKVPQFTAFIRSLHFVQINFDSFTADDDKRFEGTTVCNDAGHARKTLVISGHWGRNGGIFEVDGNQNLQVARVSPRIEPSLIPDLVGHNAKI
jgi:hypothetical protein